MAFWKNEKRSEPVVVNQNVSDGTILSFLNSENKSALNISTFYRGVQLISSAISQLPIYTKKENSKGNTNILKNHPTNLLWKDTTNLVDKVTMIRTIVQSIILKGNAYVYIHRAEDGTPIKLRFLESSDVTIYYDKNRDYLEYGVRCLTSHRVKPENMLHFKLFTTDGVKGISLLSFAQQSTNTANAANTQASDFFNKGCSNISGIIKVNSQLTDKQRQQILTTWSNTYSNSKAGLAVLQGNMEYQSLTINPDDAQLLESREFSQADVCQFLNISPSQLGLKGYTNYTNFEDANNDLLQRTLMPYISCIESELTRKLLTADEIKNVKIILDTVGFLRPNKQAQSQYYTSLVNAGILSINEVRKELGYPEIEGGNEHYIPYSDTAQNAIGKNNNTDEIKDTDNNG